MIRIIVSEYPGTINCITKMKILTFVEKKVQEQKWMTIDLFASNYSTFENYRHDDANAEHVHMAKKDEIIKKHKWHFLCKHKENNRKLKANKPFNDDDVPLFLLIPHEDHNELTENQCAMMMTFLHLLNNATTLISCLLF